MPKRRRSTKWKTKRHESELLPALRWIYQVFERASKNRAPWYALAESAQLNPQTVQRLLACTKVDRANTGRHLANYEAIARVMGYRIALVGADGVVVELPKPQPG